MTRFGSFLTLFRLFSDFLDPGDSFLTFWVFGREGPEMALKLAGGDLLKTTLEKGIFFPKGCVPAFLSTLEDTISEPLY